MQLADSNGAVIPFVPSAGLKAGVKGVKAINKIDDAVDGTKIVIKAGNFKSFTGDNFRHNLT
ncbi:MAG: hypothetical protein FWF18_02710 [Dehalococcoidia bacterium]|nr:hypothetical protein [Dehalococcoidia bacterium]